MTHVVASVAFAFGYRSGDAAPLVCSCRWEGDVAGWDDHRADAGQRYTKFAGRRNEWTYAPGVFDVTLTPAKAPRPPKPPRVPRLTAVALPEYADRVCRHGHIGEWLRNGKGHPECIVCRRDQRRPKAKEEEG